MGSVRGVRPAATAFLVSMRVTIRTGGPAAAIACCRRRMLSRRFLGGMATAALAGRHAFVQDDLLRHVMTPLVSANPCATWISLVEIDGVAVRVRDAADENNRQWPDAWMGIADGCR